jgi:hypothetical protein
VYREDSDSRPCQQCSRHVQVETIYLGDRRIQIRTSVLEEKSTACNMLCCYADELKEGFLPWVQQVRAVLQQVVCDCTLQGPCRASSCISSGCVPGPWGLAAWEDVSAAL